MTDDIAELLNFLDTEIVTPEVRNMFKMAGNPVEENHANSTENNMSQAYRRCSSLSMPDRLSGWSGVRNQISTIECELKTVDENLSRKVLLLEDQIHELQKIIKTQGDTINFLKEDNVNFRKICISRSDEIHVPMGISTHSTKTSALHECTDDTNARVNPATITNSLTNSSPEQQQNQVAVAVENASLDGKPTYSDAVKLPKKKQNHTDVPITGAEHDGSSPNTETTRPTTIQSVVIPDDHENIEPSETNAFIGVERTRVRTKRFFLSGIDENVSAELILAYLSKRNINPTLLRVFPSRRKGTNSAKIYVRTSDVGTLPKDNF